MDRPTFSKVVVITSLINTFNEGSLEKFEKSFFKQLKCENKAQFFCNVLNSMYGSMSNASLQQLQKEAIQISEFQKTVSLYVHARVFCIDNEFYMYFVDMF